MAKVPTNLVDWFLENKSSPPGVSAPETFLLMSYLKAMIPLEEGESSKTQEAELALKWARDLALLVEQRGEAKDVFFSVTNFLTEQGLMLPEFYSNLATACYSRNLLKEFSEIIQPSAEYLEHSGISFLCAWSLKHCAEYQKAIEICENQEIEDGYFHLLQGQALLERGLAGEAIEELVLAKELLPGEHEAWLHLARAYYSVDEYYKSWDSAWVAYRLNSDFLDVLAIMEVIVFEFDAPTNWLLSLWDALKLSLNKYTENEGLFYLAATTAIKSGNKPWLDHVISAANWDSLRSNNRFYKNLPEILRMLNHHGWNDHIVFVIDQISVSSSSQQPT